MCRFFVFPFVSIAFIVVPDLQVTIQSHGSRNVSLTRIDRVKIKGNVLQEEIEIELQQVYSQRDSLPEIDWKLL